MEQVSAEIIVIKSASLAVYSPTGAFFSEESCKFIRIKLEIISVTI